MRSEARRTEEPALFAAAGGAHGAEAADRFGARGGTGETSGGDRWEEGTWLKKSGLRVSG